VEGPQITRILNNVERSSQAVSDNAEPLLGDGRAVLADTRKLTRALAADDQVARLEAITRDIGQAAASAKTAAGEAEALVGRVKRGQGTAGQLLADEALYDDLSELIRDLKHNPWKLLWKQ
jgi:phospholipid/cholesterol/gamma-HCH transport system substrate-binding protein